MRKCVHVYAYINMDAYYYANVSCLTSSAAYLLVKIVHVSVGESYNSYTLSSKSRSKTPTQRLK